MKTGEIPERYIIQASLWTQAIFEHPRIVISVTHMDGDDVVVDEITCPWPGCRTINPFTRLTCLRCEKPLTEEAYAPVDIEAEELAEARMMNAHAYSLFAEARSTALRQVVGGLGDTDEHWEASGIPAEINGLYTEAHQALKDSITILLAKEPHPGTEVYTDLGVFRLAELNTVKGSLLTDDGRTILLQWHDAEQDGEPGNPRVPFQVWQDGIVLSGYADPHSRKLLTTGVAPEPGDSLDG